MVMWLARAALAAVAIHSAALNADAISHPHFSDGAIVFRHQDLLEGTLPALIYVREYPAVFSSQLRISCMGVQMGRDDTLVFLPGSQQCSPLGNLLNSRIDDEQPIQSNPSNLIVEEAGLRKKLEKNRVLVVQPSDRTQGRAGICGCSTNTAPVVSVISGTPQETIGGAVIASIEFSATDSDSEVLLDVFSFTFNDGSRQDGLPSGLSSNCTAGSGTLDCSVTGTAPMTPGLYEIKLEVSDGLDTGHDTASITVTNSSNTIFKNGFEDQITL